MDLEDEIQKDLGENPQIVAESMLECGKKFVAVENEGSLVVLKFAREGEGDPECIAKLDDYDAEMSDMIPDQHRGETQFVNDILLTNNGEVIKIGAKVD